MNTKSYAAIAATIATLGMSATMAHAQQSINVTVDGGVVNFAGQQPIEQYGSVLVPLRGVFERLGATVAYDGNTKSVLAVRGATTVSLQLGSRDAKVNNRTRTLSVPAQAVNGSTLVPLRFVSEALGAQVEWQAPSRTVIVSTNGGGGTPIPDRNPPVAGRPRPNNRYTYGRIAFNWDGNGIAVRDRAALEAQIRRELNNDPGSRFLTRREGSDGTLDVNVSLRRQNPGNVMADVRLGLDQGNGGSVVSASESATTASRNNEVNGQVVVEAFRKARREFTTNLNQFVRSGR